MLQPLEVAISNLNPLFFLIRPLGGVAVKIEWNCTHKTLVWSWLCSFLWPIWEIEINVKGWINRIHVYQKWDPKQKTNKQTNHPGHCESGVGTEDGWICSRCSSHHWATRCLEDHLCRSLQEKRAALKSRGTIFQEICVSSCIPFTLMQVENVLP